MKVSPTSIEVGAETVAELSKAATAHPALAVGAIAFGALIGVAMLVKEIPNVIEAMKKD